MRHSALQTSLIRAGMEALGVGIRRQKNILLYGPPGIGKSTFIQHALNRRGLWEGRRLRVVSIPLFRHQTARQALYALCRAIEGDGAEPYARTAESAERLFFRLLDLVECEHADSVLALVDEADYAVGGDLTDLLRDAFDEAGGRLLFGFVSIAVFAAKMANPATPLLEAAASRLAVHRRLPSASQADAQLLADHLVEGVRLDSDLVSHLLKGARGSIRSLLDRYEEVEDIARIADVERLSLARWNDLRRLAGGAVDETSARRDASTTQLISHSGDRHSQSAEMNNKKAVA